MLSVLSPGLHPRDPRKSMYFSVEANFEQLERSGTGVAKRMATGVHVLDVIPITDCGDLIKALSSATRTVLTSSWSL